MTAAVRFPAFGSTAIVVVTDPARLATARATVERVIAGVDLACSRFRADSELSALNAAAGSPVAVSSLLMDAVSAALRAARLTDGDVDPTVGQALIALGYDRDFASVAVAGATPARPVSIATVSGWRTIQLDREASTIRLSPGTKLDLGATAKALAADRAAAGAHAATGAGALVSLGGDIAAAGSPPSDGWRIRVTDDHRSGVDAPGQWITMRAGALATSSTTARRWQAGSQPAHHLIDPATGEPATIFWRSVSVSAASCLDANIASTAAIVRGQRGAAWLESLGLPSRLVSADGAVRHLAGWPADGDDLPPPHASRELLA